MIFHPITCLNIFKFVSFDGHEDGFDVLDPNGNVTIKWDKTSDDGDTQTVSFLHLYSEILVN